MPVQMVTDAENASRYCTYKRLLGLFNIAEIIHCVCNFMGPGVNQDGRSASFTAPFGPSQELLIRRVNSQHSVHPNNIKFISSHGTGTSLGDPIELAAIAKAYEGCIRIVIGAR